MADVLIHPDDVDGDTAEDLQKAADFFISIGLLKAGDRFVVDQSASRDDGREVDDQSAGSACKDACRAAYEIAKAACNLTGNPSKCRKKAKKAYQACVLACDLTGG